MLNGQVGVVYLIVELINHIFQKTIVNLIIFMFNIIVKNKCFFKPYNSCATNIKLELDFCNYATKYEI